MIERILQIPARFLYQKLKKSRLAYLCFPKSVQRDIDILNQSEEEYYIQKLEYICGFMVVSFMFLTAYIICIAFDGTKQIASIPRPEAYEETKEVTLKTGKLNDSYCLEIAPVCLSKEEAELELEKVLNELESYILGKNSDLENIESNMLLPEQIEGYPFDIAWQSTRKEVIDSFGVVNRKGLNEDCIVVLTAEFSYQEWTWEEQFGVLVKKEVLSETEQYQRNLMEFLKQEEYDQRDKKEWKLPDSFKEEALCYQKIDVDDSILILAIIVGITGILIWIGQDNDLHRNRIKRQQEFRLEYTAFVGSLSLYILAGVNLQTALRFCTKDYERRMYKGHLLREALLDFQKDMQNGYGFSEALNRFAETADDVNYRKLVGLLNQGMINGVKGLSVLLEQEVEKSQEEKRRQSRVKGEEISTALIAPMMLQLGMIIALIMIPAFTSMQF